MAAPQNSERALCADAWQHGAWRVCVSQGRCEIPHTSQGGPFMIPPYSGVQAAGTRVVSDWRQESNHDKASGVPVGPGVGSRTWDGSCRTVWRVRGSVVLHITVSCPKQ